MAVATAAQYATIKTDQAAFAATLPGPVAYVNGDGTVDVITPTGTTPPGYTVVTLPLLQ